MPTTLTPPERKVRVVREEPALPGPGFFQRHRGVLIAVVTALGVCAFLAFQIFGGHKVAPKKQEVIHMITLPPPIPPPPPPPQKVMPPVPKMEAPVPAAKPQNTLVAPKDDAMKATNGPGDSFNLTGSLNGHGTGGGGRWGWYGASVKAAVEDALHKNGKTKNASLHISAKIWQDKSGRVTRVVISDPTGDKDVDGAVKDEVLAGLELPPVPPDMPMPIVMQITH